MTCSGSPALPSQRFPGPGKKWGCGVLGEEFLAWVGHRLQRADPGKGELHLGGEKGPAVELGWV